MGRSEAKGELQAVATATLRLQLPADRASLALVRSVTESFLRAGSRVLVDDERLREVLLAVQEACNNVIMHAYPKHEPGPLGVRYDLDGARLTIRVIDQGPGFDSQAVLAREVDPAHLGRGYGLYLIRGLMDELTFERGAEGHIVRMDKRLEVAPQDGVPL